MHVWNLPFLTNSHTLFLSLIAPVCPFEKGFILTNDGRCVCPVERGFYVDENGNCQRCPVEVGFVLTEDGRCICDPEKGYVITRDGTCDCPLPAVKDADGTCVGKYLCQTVVNSCSKDVIFCMMPDD